MRSFIAAFKLFSFFVWSLMIVPAQILVLLCCKGRAAYVLPQIWHRGVCFIFGLRIRILGVPETAGQVMYLSNHLSYLDIPVIGTVLHASFVAKKDVESWPVFGFLSKMQQTAFIQRSRNAAVREAGSLDGMLEAGKSLIIFPEGTSTIGEEVLPFKSSLFSIFVGREDSEMVLQPMTVVLSAVNGVPPETREERDVYAWHRDMDTELPDHLWSFAKNKGARITLTFHTPIRACDYQDRKVLAKTCHEQVSNGLEIKHAA